MQKMQKVQDKKIYDRIDRIDRLGGNGQKGQNGHNKKLYDKVMRRARSTINYADSVYTLRSKRSPAHILSRTPSRKNGSERVYTVSLAERWASNVLERRAIILP